MEVNGRNSPCNEKTHPEISTTPNKQKRPAEDSTGTSVFVNHAIAWHENRRQWSGGIISPKSKRMPTKDPVISWSITYEDLLSTNDAFSDPIPLHEMVDFLVDIWHDEGLFDSS